MLIPGDGNCADGLEKCIRDNFLEHCGEFTVDNEALKKMCHAIACSVVYYLLQNAEFKLADTCPCIPKWGDPGIWGDGGTWELNSAELLTIIKLK